MRKGRIGPTSPPERLTYAGFESVWTTVKLKIQQGVAPLRVTSLLERCRNTRNCPGFSDLDWLAVGVSRGLRADPSGRAFLQALAEIAQRVLGRSNFFESLKSQRRLKLLSKLLESVCDLARDELADPLAQYEALKDFDHKAPLNRGVVSDQLV
ncbi:MAG: hypothetical protein ACI9OD_005220, partial [Limisphaerales bacterium]